MYTENHFYIPNQETFEKNQSGEYTTDQLAFFEQFTVFRFSIKQNSDTFLYNKKDKIFQFKQTKLNFLQSIEPFANRDGRMMPGITYEICYFEPEKSEAIFLSAKCFDPKVKIQYQKQ